MAKFKKLQAHKDLSKARSFVLVTDRVATISGDFSGLTRIQAMSALRSLKAELTETIKQLDDTAPKKAKASRSSKKKSGARK